MDIEKLSEYFSPMDIEWRIQQAGWKNDKPWAMVLAYITNRAIMDRLDDVCGKLNWQNHYQVASDGAIMCGISIFAGNEGEWITKWDAAEATDIEAIKGGRSNAMKRAGVQWGIGRYLYNLDTAFAETSTEWPSREEKPLWNKHYDKKENKAFFWKIPNLPSWAIPKGEG